MSHRMSSVCEIKGYEGVTVALSSLSSAMRGKAMLDALTEGAKVLKEETRKNLVAKLGPSATRRGLRWRKYQQNHSPMVEGINVIRDSGYGVAVVSIMRDFRLKWFEKGTDQRWAGGRKTDGKYAGQTNASNYRGAIKAEHFFLDARNREESIERAIFESLDKTINRILK